MSDENSKLLPESVLAALRGASSVGSTVWTSIEPVARRWGVETTALLRHYLDGGYDGVSQQQPLTAPLITFEGVTAAFGGEVALRDVSGVFAAGSMSAVVGPNGAGKSTLLKLAAHRLAPLSGSVRVEPADPRAIAFLPQRAEIDTSFPITALDFVGLGAWRRFGALATPDSDALARARQALTDVGLSDMAQRRIGELSVGQLQRLLFARLLLLDAPGVLLDEPFAGIDEATAEDLLGILCRWHEQGRTVVAVLHDLDQARQAFPDCLLLARGVIAWGPTASTLTDQAMRAAQAAMRGG